MVLPAQTVAVVGCSGQQGRAVTEALLQSKKWTVRGLTRDTTKPACKELERRGMQPVQCDLDNIATLKPAFSGATAAFLLTNYFDERSRMSEIDQGMNEVNAAVEAGVRTIVFSSLPDAEKVSNGKYKVPHFTGKSKIEAHLRDLRRQNRIDALICVYVGFYWQNFATFFTCKPQREQDGSIVYYYPVDPTKTAICTIDVNDLGPIVTKVLENPKEWDGRQIFASSECLTLSQMLQIMGEECGKRIIAKQTSDQECRRMGMPDEMIEMFKFVHDCGFYGGDAIGPLAKQLNPNMKDFRGWLRSNQEWRAAFNSSQ